MLNYSSQCSLHVIVTKEVPYTVTWLLKKNQNDAWQSKSLQNGLTICIKAGKYMSYSWIYTVTK